eukprot:gene23263-9570_t
MEEKGVEGSRREEKGARRRFGGGSPNHPPSNQSGFGKTVELESGNRGKTNRTGHTKQPDISLH